MDALPTSECGKGMSLLEFGGSFHVGIYAYHSVRADDMGFYPGIKHQRILSFNFQA